MDYNRSEKHLSNLALARQKANVLLNCCHCSKSFTKTNLKKHEMSCGHDPSNHITCPVCEKSFFPKEKGQVCCCHGCANTFFRSGPENGNWNEDHYRTTCFHHHDKKCVVCGEENIVEVHHLDENHSNNSPSNLIPLCPTHHQYWHSKFRYMVEPKIMEYVLGASPL